jgi:hypothetical protein
VQVAAGFSPRTKAAGIVRRVATPDCTAAIYAGLSARDRGRCFQASLTRRSLNLGTFPWAEAHGYLHTIATRCYLI